MNDSAPETTTSDFNITITDKGPALKEISIEIPAEKVNEKLEESFATFASEAQVPGFRKGRVPRRLLERKFGKNVRDETKNQLVAAAYSEAVEENKLRVLGEPAADELKDLEIVEGEALKFSVSVEVAPDFELPDTAGLKINRPVAEVDDEMIAKELKTFQLYHGTLEPIEGEPEDGAYLTGHGIMRDTEDHVLLDLPGAVVQIPPADAEGKGAILGVMVDDFAKQLGHPQAGETKIITCKGPDNHENEEVRGKDLKIEFATEKTERVVPAPVEDLLEQFGMTDETQLQEQLKARLEQRIVAEQFQAMRSQVAKHLLESVEFELPEKLTAAQVTRNLERARMDMMYRGVAAEEVEARIAEQRSASEESSRKELKAMFIIDRLAEEKEISINEAEVNGQIAQLAAQRGMRPEQLRQELIKTGRIQSLAQQIREHKVLDQIISEAEVEDMPAEEYNEKIAAEKS
jgi:trigger factor